MASRPRCGFCRRPGGGAGATAAVSARFRRSHLAVLACTTAQQCALLLPRHSRPPQHHMQGPSACDVKRSLALLLRSALPAALPSLWPPSLELGADFVVCRIPGPMQLHQPRCTRPAALAYVFACTTAQQCLYQQMHWLGCGCAFGFALILSLRLS